MREYGIVTSVPNSCFRLRMNLQRHLARSPSTAPRATSRLREADHEHFAARQLVRLVAAIAAHGEQRRVRQARRIGESVHAAGQRVDAGALFVQRSRGEPDAAIRSASWSAVCRGVGIDDSAHVRTDYIGQAAQHA